MNGTRGAKTQASSLSILAKHHCYTVFVINLRSLSRVLMTPAKMESHMCQNMAFLPSALCHPHLPCTATFPSPPYKLIRRKARRKDRQTDRDTTAAFKIVAVKDLSESLKGQHSVPDRMSYSGWWGKEEEEEVEEGKQPGRRKPPKSLV